MANHDDVTDMEALQKAREMAPGVFAGDIGPIEAFFQQARARGLLGDVHGWLNTIDDEGPVDATDSEPID
jgi:hypothetical protein